MNIFKKLLEKIFISKDGEFREKRWEKFKGDLLSTTAITIVLMLAVALGFGIIWLITALWNEYILRIWVGGPTVTMGTVAGTILFLWIISNVIKMFRD